MATSKEQPYLKIGITGHQERRGANWTWVSNEMRKFLSQYSEIEGWSSLASGADQIFADAVLQLRGTLIAVIPLENYESYFPTNQSRSKYASLLNKSKTILRIGEAIQPKEAFYSAGRRIVESTEVMAAVWDELPARGLGGTADVVKYAQQLKRPVFILNPIGKVSRWR
ncbi:hypothetical protein [Bradyrhizobium sp. Ec3.3]|uniref:hypothetical protein n=1 Tax=Bradyrhizobium sp. Ec3.3 TaxID=189753 RepID=UPI0012EC2E28|nr:hypothetical protein [Bradyrhizobium sp. Ec3.3]